MGAVDRIGSRSVLPRMFVCWKTLMISRITLIRFSVSRAHIWYVSIPVDGACPIDRHIGYSEQLPIHVSDTMVTSVLTVYTGQGHVRVPLGRDAGHGRNESRGRLWSVLGNPHV